MSKSLFGVSSLPRLKFRMMRPAVCAGLITSLLAACGGGGGEASVPAPSTTSDVALSWENARVYTPFSSVPGSVRQLALVPPSPVAIMLHGCTGLEPEGASGTDQEWGAFLAQQGYLVIMPDSMARPSRQGVLTCNPATLERGLNMWVYDLRIEEANYALRMASTGRWYDRQRLILGGHSEGAATIYRATYDGPTDLIMSGFWCVPNFTTAKPGQRMLYLNSSMDPWYYTGAPFDASLCLVPGYDITSITLEGSIHDGLSDPVAREAALNFVRMANERPQGP